MNKESLINKITLIDTSIYRKIGLINTGKYKKEPINYRKDLRDVYINLDIDALSRLLKIKNTL